MARRRHLSRIAVMQTLFQREKRPSIDVQATLALRSQELGKMDEEFAGKLMEGVLAHEAELQTLIREHAPGWTPERMDPIARSTLLIGAYELTMGNGAPPAVVINEAIDVAKEYCTEESGKFVNGVLNAIAHRAE